jgi:hypothetical protein
LSLTEERAYAFDAERVPDCCGVYIFLRSHGKSTEALYVGQAERLRRRMIQYRDQQQKLNSHARRIMDSIHRADSGSRWLLLGEIQTRQGQQLERVLGITERALIKHFLSLGHRLVNKHGTRLETDTIQSVRTHFRKLVPRTLSIEKSSSHKQQPKNRGFLASLLG